MSTNELLYLRKTLSELLDKGFIYISSSQASAPVLFTKKPSGGLRFCVDYRNLNEITKKDRYPLPLIKETLKSISKAKWFTKLDIIAAFNKIRIAAGQEWMTAFRTRLGLYEWLVMPFGMANAPSVFQRYINHTLAEFLDDFASAYVDDVLIYTDGSLAEHKVHVKKVLGKLMDAGLQIDIDKCAFFTKSTTYLGFIINAERGISMDPRKVAAVTEWQLPSSTKGIRGFLGFANFYRDFIPRFAEISGPLNDLLKKDAPVPFRITEAASAAFRHLKNLFITAPMIAFFDHNSETLVQCDASGWNTGAALLQRETPDKPWRPVGFFSKKMSPAETNYQIHDKELLAVVLSLKEWQELLKPLEKFTIQTDHKNLEYFKSLRQLNERQTRWAQFLSQFQFKLEYKPGKDNVVADALSRRDQDMPKDTTDIRLSERTFQLLKPDQFSAAFFSTVVNANRTDAVSMMPPDDLLDLWDTAQRDDEVYNELLLSVRKGERQAPESCRQWKLSMNDLSLASADPATTTTTRERFARAELLWKRRRWVPDSEPLRTGILQTVHDSTTYGHPGRNAMYGILSRSYFWPGMSTDVNRFIDACNHCGRNTVWRDLRQGLLQPLPIPEATWTEITMDYVTDLPLTKDGNTNLLTVTDRLSKNVIFAPVPNLEGETLARTLLTHLIGHHGFPTAITSDRGDQFVKGVWGKLCEIVGIRKRLSTAYRPQTDGASENRNQFVEEYIRVYTNEHQNDWDRWLPMAQLAVASRPSRSLGISPFFMTHGRDPSGPEDIVPPEVPTNRRPSPSDLASNMVRKLKDVWSFAQATMAHAQQQQETYYNRRHAPSPAYKVGDKVWLDMRHFRVPAPKLKKLCALHR
jgi:transposase InsO family protein